MPSLRITVLRIALFVFLMLSTLAILYTTAQNARSVRDLSNQSLESTALALASTIEGDLRSGDNMKAQHVSRILSDQVVAYALVSDLRGKIVFHTNPALMGYRLTEKDLDNRLRTGKVSSRRIILRTGLPGFEFNYPLHLQDGGVQLLRLVLHTYPADQIISRTSGMWWTVGLVLIILWSIGILFERLFSRQLRLQQLLHRSEQLALIGQMTSVLAHEIRNTLGSIKGYTQWVDEKMESADPKKTGLAFVLKGTDRIESLVQDLLDFSREETYHLEPLVLDQIIRETVDSEFFQKPGKPLIEMEPGLRVTADREKLHRVLRNGLRNAVEATENDPSLHLQAGARGKWVEIRIEDSGPGISAEELPKLFTPFHTTKITGTGLGLAYSKKVIEGMRGEITLSNRLNHQGAVLVIRLPKSKRG
jgi:two-component system sensor histidine kinase HydH